MTPRYIVNRKRLYQTKPSKIIFWEEFEDRAEAVARFYKEYGEGAAEVWPAERIDAELGRGFGACEFWVGTEMVRLLHRF